MNTHNSLINMDLQIMVDNKWKCQKGLYNLNLGGLCSGNQETVPMFLIFLRKTKREIRMI